MTLGAERDRDRRLLGDHRRARGVAAAARDAVPDPRELRGRCSDEDVRAGRGCCRDRCRRGAVARRLRDHLPLLAGRLRARGRRDRDRAVPDQACPRRGRTRGRARSTSSARSSRSSAWAASCSAFSSGRKAATYVGLLMAIGADRADAARVLARAPQASGEADAARPGPVQVPALHDRGSRGSCCRT